MENEIIKVDFVDPFDMERVEWLLVRHVVSRTRVLDLLVFCVQTFLNLPDPLFEPLFRYIAGDSVENSYAERFRIGVAVVVIDEVAALVAINFVSAGPHGWEKGTTEELCLFSVETFLIPRRCVDGQARIYTGRYYDSLGIRSIRS